MRSLALAALAAGCNVPVVHFTPAGGSADAPLADSIDAPMVASGNYVWVRSLSQVQTQTITAAATGIITPGYLYTTADLNGTLLTSAGGADLVVAAFTEGDATNLFAVRHGDVGNEFGLLATPASNNVPIVTGVDSGDKIVDLGLGPVSGGGTPIEDGYIGSYTNGIAGWVQRIVGPGSDKFLGSARGPNGTMYGAGWFEQTTSFNSGTLTSVGGRDIIVARFNSYTGAVDLTKQYGGTGRDEVSGGGIAALPTDPTYFVMSGFYDDTINFGGTASPITAAGGGLDMWIAKFDSNGDGIWAVTYGGAGDDRDVSCVLDAQGDVYIVGSFTTSISFGSTTLTAVGGSGTDPFIAKLRGSDGSPVWAISFGSVNSDGGGRIAVDARGHLAFAGAMAGQLGNMPTLGGRDGYLAEFSTADGSLIWDHLYSTGADDGTGGVVYGLVTGDLFASVGVGGAYDFGMPIIGDPAPIDVLIRIAP
jgi:hypothetical protein